MSTRQQERERIKDTIERVEASSLSDVLKEGALILLKHGPTKRQVTVIRKMLERNGY